MRGSRSFRKQYKEFQEFLRGKPALLPIFRGGTWLLAFTYFLYDSVHAHEKPIPSAIHAGVLVILSHLLVNTLFDHSEDDKLKAKRHLDSVVKPLKQGMNDMQQSINQLKDCIDEYTQIVSGQQNLDGMVAVHPKMDFDAFFDSATQGERIIMYDTFVPKFDKFLPSLTRAIERGVTVRFLVLDPDSNSAKQRQEEITFPHCIPFKKYSAGITDYVQAITELYAAVSKKFPDAIEARYFSFMPNMPIYVIEDNQGNPRRAFQGFYLRGSSENGHHGEWRFATATCSLSEFHRYLDEKWERNAVNAIPLESKAA